MSVKDVASAFVISLQNPKTIHGIYDLVGPEVFTMQDIVLFATRKIGKDNLIVPMPSWAGYLQALMFELSPGPTLMSRDNIASMSVPNILPTGGRDALVEDFGIAKQRLESLLI